MDIITILYTHTSQTNQNTRTTILVAMTDVNQQNTCQAMRHILGGDLVEVSRSSKLKTYCFGILVNTGVDRYILKL